MKLVVAGVNHKTAPIELRERLAIAQERLADVTRSLIEEAGVREAMVLSTCNRVEVVACHDQAELPVFFQKFFAIDPAELRPHFYEHADADAVRHLFRVASSLDSMIVGEPQILGQVKEAYAVARSVGAAHAQMDRLLQAAFATAKKVRTDTQIGSSSVSIASVAVDLARKIFGSLDNRRVLLVGAGKMSELAAKHLIQQGANSILVANRTHQRAVHLAQSFGGSTLRFEDLYATADQADIIITSTGSATPIFRREHGQQFLHRRRNRPMFFIDIAVPRDVDPEMNKVDGVFLYDIDDLQSVAASHLANRKLEAEKAEAIISLEVERFQRRSLAVDVVPTIVALQRSIEELRQAELRRAQSRLQSLNPEQIAAVDAVTRGLANKFLHLPLAAIKAASLDGNAAAIEMMRNIFKLTEVGEEDESVVTALNTSGKEQE